MIDDQVIRIFKIGLSLGALSMRKFSGLVALTSMMVAAPAFAGAPTVTKIQNADGDVGSVRLFRAGLVQVVTEGDELQLGDRIVTRPGGSVELQFDNCIATLDTPDTMVITEDTCGLIKARQVVGAGAGAGAGGAAGGAAAGAAAGATGIAGIATGVPVVAVTAGVVGVGAVVGTTVAVTNGGDEPVSG